MAATEGKWLSALIKGSSIPASTERREVWKGTSQITLELSFLQTFWNEGLKLPTRHDCPECSNQYREYRQSQTNRRSIHAQNAYHHNNMDRRLKNKSVHDRLRKRVVDQDCADDKEEGTGKRHIWQEGLWCLGGLTRNKKRRVQHLRNKEME